MKHLTILVFSLLFTLAVNAQQTGLPKPKLFTNFPDLIICSESQLANLFTLPEGQNINIAFSNSFNFSGTVTSNLLRYSNLQTVIIKSPAFNNSIFHISKRTDPDNSITYVGSIINQKYFDGYELKRDMAGNYQLIKIQTDMVIPVDSFQ